MRRLIALCLAAIAAAALVAAACSSSESFSCQSDAVCLLVEIEGLCVQGDCAYPDDTCMSGYRFAMGAKMMADECVDPAAIPGGGTDSDS